MNKDFSGNFILRMHHILHELKQGKHKLEADGRAAEVVPGFVLI